MAGCMTGSECCPWACLAHVLKHWASSRCRSERSDLSLESLHMCVMCRHEALLPALQSAHAPMLRSSRLWARVRGRLRSAASPGKRSDAVDRSVRQARAWSVGRIVFGGPLAPHPSKMPQHGRVMRQVVRMVTVRLRSATLGRAGHPRQA